MRLPFLAAAVIAVTVHAGSVWAQAPIPDAARAEALIKTTLVALNHANLTGNYTVLRDLGSLRFRANNTAARLAAVFAPLREDGIDLAPIVLFQPQIVTPIGLDDEGRLRLIGQFPTRPLRVVFDIAFETTGNRWSISDVSVNAAPWPEEDGNGDEQGSLSQPSQGSLSQLPVPRPRPVQ